MLMPLAAATTSAAAVDRMTFLGLPPVAAGVPGPPCPSVPASQPGERCPPAGGLLFVAQPGPSPAEYVLGVFVTREHVRHNKSGIAHRGRTRIYHCIATIC
jgi:hypothetical protein